MGVAYLFVWLCACVVAFCVIVCLPACLFVCLFACLRICVLVCLIVWFFACLDAGFARLSVCLCVFVNFVCLSFCQFA